MPKWHVKRGTLIAITATVNRQKSGWDPQTWLPQLGRCQFAIDYLGTKYRWNLAVDPAEKRVLTRVLTGPCGAVPVRLPPRV